MRKGLHWWMYPLALTCVLLVWALCMTAFDGWHLLAEWWEISVTMLVGSFVAGATAAGGGAVAYPVMTKMLEIPSADARTFSLMVQAVGMSMAAFFVVTRKVKVLPFAIWWATVGASLGLAVGTFWWEWHPPISKALFTTMALCFAVALYLIRWRLNWSTVQDLPRRDWSMALNLVLVGIPGGLIAANTGVGSDIPLFILLSVAYGIDERIGVPTSVTVIGTSSIVGFALHLLKGDIGPAWEYWAVGVPMVVFGAPLGSYVASIVSRDSILFMLLGLIAVEVVSTAILLEMSADIVTIATAVALSCLVWFWSMFRYRARTAGAPTDKLSA